MVLIMDKIRYSMCGELMFGKFVATEHASCFLAFY